MPRDMGGGRFRFDVGDRWLVAVLIGTNERLRFIVEHVEAQGCLGFQFPDGTRLQDYLPQCRVGRTLS